MACPHPSTVRFRPVLTSQPKQGNSGTRRSPDRGERLLPESCAISRTYVEKELPATVPRSYTLLMGWVGLIVAILGAFFGAVSAYYDHVDHRRARADHRPDRDAGPHQGLGRSRRRPWRYVTVAAVCVVLLGIAIAVLPHGSRPNPALQPSFSPSPLQSSSASTRPSPSASAVWNKQWGPGTLLFSDNVYDDLDLVPPDVTGNSNSSNASVLLYSGQFVSSSNEIVSWTGKESGSPTAAACAALISTQGIGAVNVVTGHTYCYKTGDGNIAVIVPTRETVKEDGSVSNVLIQATVWKSSS